MFVVVGTFVWEAVVFVCVVEAPVVLVAVSVVVELLFVVLLVSVVASLVVVSEDDEVVVSVTVVVSACLFTLELALPYADSIRAYPVWLE